MSEHDGVREHLAALSHAQWTGWMEWTRAVGHVDTQGRWVVPREAAERWRRQMQTAYADLPEQEKESDRAEADRVLALLGAGLLRRLVQGWAACARQYAAAAEALAMERGTAAVWESAAAQTHADERAALHVVLAEAALPETIRADLVALFDATVEPHDDER